MSYKNTNSIEKLEEVRRRSAHHKVMVIALTIAIVAVAAVMIVASATAVETVPYSGSQAEVVAAKPTEEVKEDVADHYLRFDASGPGHIEPVSNCVIDGVKGYIDVDDLKRLAKFRLVLDDPAAVADATIEGGDLMIDGDIVMISKFDRESICHVTFVRDIVVEAPVQENSEEQIADSVAPASAAPAEDPVSEVVVEEPVYEEPVYEEPAYEEPVYTASYDWYAPVSDEPSTWGIVDYQGLGWYCAHSNTSYGQAIASLQPGDQVTINGRTVTIEGRARNEIDTYIWPLWDEIGRDKVLFSTCCEDGSNDVWVVYGS